MPPLVERDCVHRDPHEGLSAEEIASYWQEVPDWKLDEEEPMPRIQRSFKFKDFAQALEFTNRVARVAETQDHHPQIITEWGRATVIWWTHTVKGLSENDFIMAAKTDALLSGAQS